MRSRPACRPHADALRMPPAPMPASARPERPEALAPRASEDFDRTLSKSGQAKSARHFLLRAGSRPGNSIQAFHDGIQGREIVSEPYLPLTDATVTGIMVDERYRGYAVEYFRLSCFDGILSKGRRFI